MLSRKEEGQLVAVRRIRVNIEVPEEVGDQTRAVAEARAREAVVLAVWQAGKLTNREAALELGLSYHDFLDLLAAHGIPVVSGGEINVEAIDQAAQRLASEPQ